MTKLKLHPQVSKLIIFWSLLYLLFIQLVWDLDYQFENDIIGDLVYIGIIPLFNLIAIPIALRLRNESPKLVKKYSFFVPFSFFTFFGSLAWLYYKFTEISPEVNNVSIYILKLVPLAPFAAALTAVPLSLIGLALGSIIYRFKGTKKPEPKKVVIPDKATKKYDRNIQIIIFVLVGLRSYVFSDFHSKYPIANFGILLDNFLIPVIFLLIVYKLSLGKLKKEFKENGRAFTRAIIITGMVLALISFL